MFTFLLHRRRSLAALLLVGVLVLSGCGDDDSADEVGVPDDSGQDVYFGYVFGREEITAVAVDLAAPAEDGTRRASVYICDGLGEPGGLAVWFGGGVDPAETDGPGTSVELTAKGGDELLRIGNVSDFEVRGVFVDSGGTPSRFVASRAIDGAGIYDLTLDEDLHYTGTSTSGATLVGVIEGKIVSGTITLPDGRSIDFVQESLARSTPDELRDYGLSGAASTFVHVDQVPDDYVAVVSPSGSHWFGRSGQVRGGSSGNNIIGLDMWD